MDYYVLGVEGLKLNTDKEPEYIHVPASANSPFIRQCFENILREMHNNRTATQRSASIIWIF